MGIEAWLSTQIIDATTVGRAVMVAADAAAARTAIDAAATSHTHAAGDITSGTIDTIRLGSGTADATTYLRGDQTWQTISAGGVGGSTGAVDNAVLRADGTGGSAVQTSNWLIADNYTASPNNTVNHASIQVTGATTNVSVSIVPKGMGAFCLSVPDGTTTGGNARGSNAVDLFIGVKGAATQVASGNNSFLGPQGGTASGTGAASFGGTASGNYSFAFPGSVTASGVGAICGYVISGNQTVSGQGACAFGSSYSTVSGSRSFLIAGDFNFVTGDSCFSHGYLPAFGGPTVAGTGNFCTSGGAAASTAVWALSCGQSAQVRHRCQRAFAAGRFSALADAQGCEWVLRNKTTDGTTAVTLFLDGSAERLTIPSGKILSATAQLVGSKSDGTAVATYMRKFAIQNVGGTTALVGSVETIGTDVDAGTAVTITADNTNDAVQIAVTGVASETWRWVAVVYGVELAYGT